MISTTEPPPGIRECVEELMLKAEALGVDWSQDLLTRGPGPHSYLDVAFAIRMAAERHSSSVLVRSLFARFSEKTGLYEDVLPLCRHCRGTPFSHIEYQCAFDSTIYTPMTPAGQAQLARDSWHDAHRAYVAAQKKAGSP